jgi:hypothetical protein
MSATREINEPPCKCVYMTVGGLVRAATFCPKHRVTRDWLLEVVCNHSEGLPAENWPLPNRRIGDA